MTRYNDPANVARQYQNDGNLAKRINLHAKHSTSPISFAQWCFQQYEFQKNDCILELGCGNGMQWQGRVDCLPVGASLLLTDLSDGMVAAVGEAYAAFPCVSVRKMDIQAIPYPPETFNRVIANHMLYHVPDIPLALREVRRILRPDGVFYTTTMGTDGLRAYLHEALQSFDSTLNLFGETPSFTLQNGEALLREHFSQVRVTTFQDSLRVTDTRDLIDYIESSPALEGTDVKRLAGLYDYFEAIRLRDGAIAIPKKAGMFICRG